MLRKSRHVFPNSAEFFNDFVFSLPLLVSQSKCLIHRKSGVTFWPFLEVQEERRDNLDIFHLPLSLIRNSREWFLMRLVEPLFQPIRKFFGSRDESPAEPCVPEFLVGQFRRIAV